MSLQFHILVASAVHRRSQSWRRGTQGTPWLDHDTCTTPSRDTNGKSFHQVSRHSAQQIHITRPASVQPVRSSLTGTWKMAACDTEKQSNRTNC